jgi:lipopolysaccharide assembly outer membrane protein LptD (OstA)
MAIGRLSLVIRCLFFVLCSSLYIFELFAQTQPTDSLAIAQDTLRVDTTKVAIDTTRVSGVDTVVNYSCKDSIIYFMPSRTMSMYNESNIKYQQMELRSAIVDVNWTTSVLSARGAEDTMAVDSSDSLAAKSRGTPIMKDGGEEYRGNELSYNFRTKKGKINVGDTHIDEGYYHGEGIKKIDKEILFVENGRYTTCDKTTPHFYFFSPKMKVTMQDKVVAEPVYFYLADVPVFALPFAVFPNKGGRRSGIIAPAYGEDASRGKFLRHLGYYLAMSDYMDLALKSDLFTKGGWAAYGDYRYALRYSFTGSLSGEYRKLHTGEDNDPQRTQEESYRINILHNQDIDPTTRFNVNFTFASNNAFRNTIDLRQALDQSIVSNATLSKRWEGTPNSMNVNVSRNQNLINGNINEVLPSLSFNHSQSFPFRRKSSNNPETMDWYEQIGLSYNANATNTRTKTNRQVGGIKVNVNGKDTLLTVEDYERSRRQSISQGISFGIAPKLGYFTVSPSLSYSDNRSFSETDSPTKAQDTSLSFITMKDATRTGVISSGVGMSTKLYGMLQPDALGVQALRHTLTPNLSFTYQKQIIGEDRVGKQMFTSLNLGNNFEMKLKQEEEGKVPTKIQLLNANAGLSYNFTADSLNFSEIGVSYRTGIGEFLNIDGGTTFDLYKLEQTPSGDYVKVNKFLLKEEGRLARMTNFRISLSTTLSGERKKSKSSSSDEDTTEQVQRQASGYLGLFEEEEPDFSIPWRLSLNFDYSENKVPGQRSHQANVRGNLDFNLTENWKFGISGGYDITNKELVVPNINISRDLHCWIMNFSWVPIGAYRHYQFEIRIKAPQLQDIKVTKQGSERGIY